MGVVKDLRIEYIVILVFGWFFYFIPAMSMVVVLQMIGTKGWSIITIGPALCIAAWLIYSVKVKI